MLFTLGDVSLRRKEALTVVIATDALVVVVISGVPSNLLADNTNPPIEPADAVISPDPDKTRFLFVLDIASPVILNPPISPEVAVTLPVICAADAVSFPRFVTLNTLFGPKAIPVGCSTKPANPSVNVAFLPNVIFGVAESNSIRVLTLPVDTRVPAPCVPISHPPIVPSSDVILPVICAADAVSCPDAPFNLRVPDAASRSDPIVNPPIVPDSATIFPVI